MRQGPGVKSLAQGHRNVTQSCLMDSEPGTCSKSNSLSLKWRREKSYTASGAWTRSSHSRQLWDFLEHSFLPYLSTPTLHSKLPFPIPFFLWHILDFTCVPPSLLSQSPPCREYFRCPRSTHDFLGPHNNREAFNHHFIDEETEALRC